MEQNKSIPGYSKTCGIIALILAIASIFIPVVGIWLLVPLATILGAISLYGASNGFSIATLIIVAVKLIISPTVWLALSSAGKGNPLRGILFVIFAGIVAMIYFLVKKR